MYNKEDWEKELIELIDDNLERFLKSTPYSSLGNSDYGNKLTPDMFYSTIYYGDAESVKKEMELKKWLNDEGNNIAVVTGYTGCGKTTFVNHFIREYTNMNVVTIDFEHKNINMDRAEKRIQESNTISAKGENFQFKTEDKKYNRDLNVITYKLGLFIYQKMKNLLQKEEFRKQFLKLYDDNYDYFDENETLDNCYLENLFNYCQKYKLDELDSRQCLKNIKLVILNLNIENMFSILILMEMAKQLMEERAENVLFCFDNLDIAYEGNLLDDFYSGFLNFIMNWGTGLPQFCYDKSILGEKNIYTDFKFVFCMRETSKSKISEHFKKKTYTIVKVVNISEIYDKANIVNKRIALLEKYDEKIEKSLLHSSKIIKELLEDKYNNKNLFPLFNHDYRSSVENIVEICTSNTRLVEEYRRVNSVYYGDRIERCNKYGARGIIFRLLFDIFKENGYLDKISIFDFNEETHSQKLSIARLILTLLSNRMTVNGKESYRIENAVGIDEIYSAFANIIDPKVITDCIHNMYSMRDSRWNHLVTFETLRGNNEEHIYEEMKAYQKNDQTMKYSTVCITCSGNVYLNIMATHFEFFASRLFGSNKEPLFANKNLEIVNGHYRFESIIEEVCDVVKECCLRVKEFDMQNFLIKYPPESKYTKFLASDYVYKEKKKKRVISMFHGERILHAHISYLDAFRLYLVNSSQFNQEQKIKINELLIDKIKKYIKIFTDKNVIYSDKTVGMMRNYMQCIKKIEDRGYDDFSTFINVEMSSTNDNVEGESDGTSNL